MKIPGYNEKWIMVPLKVYIKQEDGHLGVIEQIEYKKALNHLKLYGCFDTEEEALKGGL